MVRSPSFQSLNGILKRVLPVLALLAVQLCVESAIAGSLYISRHNGTITTIDTATLAESTFASSGLFLPRGMVFDGSGNVYAANAGSIAKFTPGGIGSIFASISGGGGPLGLAFDRSGNLYADGINSSILRFTPGGVGSVFGGSSFDPDGELAFDASGNLYAACFGTNKIVRFTPDGVVSTFASTGLNGPEGLAIDGSGNVYAANFYSNTIVRFTPGGVGSVFETGTAGAQPFYLAFQSVPEPSSLTLIGTGVLSALACTLSQARRRARLERARQSVSG